MTHIVVRFLYNDLPNPNFVSKIELACVNHVHLGTSEKNTDGSIDFHFNLLKTFENDALAPLYLDATHCSLLIRNGYDLKGKDLSIQFLDRYIFLTKFNYSISELQKLISMFPELFV